MQAIRKILKVENNQLQIELPENFFSGLVEVIILPFKSRELTDIEEKQSSSATTMSDFQKLLLSGPVMSDEDFQFFNEKKAHFNEWK